jgi:hypothetical protein
VALQVLAGHQDELPLLAPVDRLGGGAEAVGAPRPDLDEDERVALLGDDVDLAQAGAPVR